MECIREHECFDQQQEDQFTGINQSSTENDTQKMVAQDGKGEEDQKSRGMALGFSHAGQYVAAF